MSDNVIQWHSDAATEFDNKYKTSNAFIERYILWEALIKKYCNKNSVVADIGCGSGVLSIVAAKHSKYVFGFDASKEMLEICENKKIEAGLKNVDFIEKRIENIDRAQYHPVNLVLCSSVLEYVDNFWSVFDSISNLLDIGGILIFSVPNKKSIYRNLEKLSFSITGRPKYFAFVNNLFNKESLSNEITDRGFRLVEFGFYAKTRFLSKITQLFSTPQYSENLFYLVCKKQRNN